MPEREEIDRSHPPAASPQPQNRRQRTAPTKHEFRQQGTPPLPQQHHDDARSLRNPPAWTSRLQPNLQAAATRTCPPGQGEEASPAGSEEPRPNEAARVMMQKAARDQGFTNWLLQVATNNRSGGDYEGATRTTASCRGNLVEQPLDINSRQVLLLAQLQVSRGALIEAPPQC
ncbi:hypothetical protein HPB50_020874 [Hyalomma asiaticum]|uniref:Uncharacterized protein n=1 Tax=Hyalomma asiaticum TaxID=266040 RepID=A0ACB7RS60_HYAAI|nr:hypothetical protein HPB50_020874 [Hyalomma asiaticum]